MNNSLTIKYIKDRDSWNNLISASTNINLMQTWEYGDAKTHSENIQVLRLAIFKSNTPVAVAQTFIKKIPIIGKIARINRGPIVLSNDWQTNNTTSIEAICFLYKYWLTQNKVPLLISPNIIRDDTTAKALLNIGLRPSSTAPWASITVDLCADENTLRKKLDIKWRNCLNKSERMDIKFETSSDEEGLLLLMKKYNDMKKAKKFSGPSESLFYKMHKMCDDSNNSSNTTVFFAIKNGQRVAGILIAGFLDTCHYLIGWNSDEGRKLNAHNFLLWHGMLHFKLAGFKWFDLGGIDTNSKHTISRFKQGIGGVKYTLIGEYEAFPNSVYYTIIHKIIKTVRYLLK